MSGSPIDTDASPNSHAGQIHISRHPLLGDKLRRLRPHLTSEAEPQPGSSSGSQPGSQPGSSSGSSPGSSSRSPSRFNGTSAEFRRTVREMSTLLAYEALADLQTEAEGGAVSEQVLLVPVLRAGLGMVDAVTELVPDATVHLVGMYRDPISLCAVEYYNKLPPNGPPAALHRCLVLDPVLATGHTLVATIDLLKSWGATRITAIVILASRDGLEHLHRNHPDVSVFLAHVDTKVDSHGYLVPGIGDAGDRIFNTMRD